MAAVLAYGQNTAEIRGTAVDRTGAILPGVSITLTNKASNQERRQLTGGGGNYVFASLPNGDYLLKAELSGFKAQIRDGITLQVGQRVNIDLLLQVGTITEEVTVTEAEPLLRTSNAEISEVINNQRLADLPLNGRQFVQLTLLSDNVYLTPIGTRGAALSQTGRQVVIAGQRVGHNLYTLDGVSITDQYLNNLVISPSIDALQEFKIQKSIYSAEFGGKSSANVNAVTKSGTNRYHGTVLEFLRNDIFDTRNYFDSPNKAKPPLRLNQYGGSLGGPVLKNRVFFFTNYEGSRERRALTRTFSLPSEKVRSGDFAGLPTIYDPLRTDATGRRLPFTANKIPAERLNPVALAFLQNVPLPTSAGEVQNFLASPSIKNDSDQATGRLDYAISPHDTFFARFTGVNMVTFQPYGNSNLNETLVPGFGYQIVTRSRNLALSHTHVFAPNLINEFRAGYLRVTGGQESENRGVDFGSLSGVEGVTRDPNKMGYPAINLADAYNSMGDPGTLTERRNNSFDFFDNLSWTSGAHSLKFGTYVYRLRFNPLSSPNARGAFDFTPRFTSSAPGLADGLRTQQPDGGNGKPIFKSGVEPIRYRQRCPRENSSRCQRIAIPSSCSLCHIERGRLQPLPAKTELQPHCSAYRLGLVAGAFGAIRGAGWLWPVFQPGGLQHQRKPRSEPAVLLQQVRHHTGGPGGAGLYDNKYLIGSQYRLHRWIGLDVQLSFGICGIVDTESAAKPGGQLGSDGDVFGFQSRWR